jgi:glycosyltransferase involved in cell wall biosynthesis
MTTIERSYNVGHEADAPLRITEVDTPLRITMLGIRGFPDVQGGAETHAQNLSARLVELGCEVEAIVRTPYVPRRGRSTFAGIRLVRLWSPLTMGVETFVHTFIGVLWSAWTRPDILHIHSVGPALFTPLARALGLRVVVTHHLANYENKKWGPTGRLILRLGERVGMGFANGRIAVSAVIGKRMERAYRVPVAVIPNGVSRPRKLASTETLTAFGLEPRRYALTVARLDEQKRQLDLINAYARISSPDWKLALVGSADHTSDYTRALAQAAAETPGVVLLGTQTGDALSELYTHAGVFVLPSSHEGQPIAVLEAMSYGCPTILSDIPPHREIAAPSAQFVPVGDIAGLEQRLKQAFGTPAERRGETSEQERFMQQHDWREIARHTVNVYRSALAQRKRADQPTSPRG